MPTSLAAALPDSALCDLLTREVTRREAAEELMRRHGQTTLAYTRVLCGNRQDTHVLMAETFNRTLDVFCDQNPPRTTWITCLLHEARRLAAQWADSGRHAALSPHFLHWLRQRGGDTPAGCVRALCGAEAESRAPVTHDSGARAALEP
ncbi:hypothetical protein [Kitasatospora sp. NPDC005751]|uniref:hypothetical protein n=1 Tax=Kitasatospora sp. NPDC005751 TaxID=3157064 RepID=UPI0033F11765